MIHLNSSDTLVCSQTTNGSDTNPKKDSLINWVRKTMFPIAIALNVVGISFLIADFVSKGLIKSGPPTTVNLGIGQYLTFETDGFKGMVAGSLFFIVQATISVLVRCWLDGNDWITMVLIGLIQIFVQGPVAPRLFIENSVTDNFVQFGISDVPLHILLCGKTTCWLDSTTAVTAVLDGKGGLICDDAVGNSQTCFIPFVPNAGYFEDSPTRNMEQQLLEYDNVLAVKITAKIENIPGNLVGIETVGADSEWKGQYNRIAQRIAFGNGTEIRQELLTRIDVELKHTIENQYSAKWASLIKFDLVEIPTVTWDYDGTKFIGTLKGTPSDSTAFDLNYMFTPDARNNLERDLGVCYQNSIGVREYIYKVINNNTLVSDQTKLDWTKGIGMSMVSRGHYRTRNIISPISAVEDTRVATNLRAAKKSTRFRIRTIGSISFGCIYMISAVGLLYSWSRFQ